MSDSCDTCDTISAMLHRPCMSCSCCHVLAKRQYYTLATLYRILYFLSTNTEPAHRASHTRFQVEMCNGVLKPAMFGQCWTLEKGTPREQSSSLSRSLRSLTQGDAQHCFSSSWSTLPLFFLAPILSTLLFLENPAKHRRPRLRLTKLE
jgi:hypothetical protein